MKSQDWREGGCSDDGGGPSKSMCTPGGLWRGKGWAWLGGGDVSLVLAWFNFEGDFLDVALKLVHWSLRGGGDHLSDGRAKQRPPMLAG